MIWSEMCIITSHERVNVVVSRFLSKYTALLNHGHGLDILDPAALLKRYIFLLKYSQKPSHPHGVNYGVKTFPKMELDTELLPSSVSPDTRLGIRWYISLSISRAIDTNHWIHVLDPIDILYSSIKRSIRKVHMWTWVIPIFYNIIARFSARSIKGTMRTSSLICQSAVHGTSPRSQIAWNDSIYAYVSWRLIQTCTYLLKAHSDQRMQES